MTCNLFAQVSTEGKDFWVTLTYATAPDGEWKGQTPYLAISSQKSCQVTISNPNTNYSTTRNVQAGTWLEITDIPKSEWFPMNGNNGLDSASVTGHSFNTGLHVTATEDISLFAANRFEKSFDAAIVIPTSVLQRDYYTQDYPPFDHNNKTSWATFCVLATAAGTTNVDITPTSTTMCNHAANTKFTVSLQQGQVYYVISKAKQTLSGTHITSDQPIAVFNGDVCTDVPGKISARDCLYEQAMPTDYWGSEFIVTRSLGKDANRIRVTAMEDGTVIKINGSSVSTINAGQTYEFEMSGGTANLEKVSKALTDNSLTIPTVFNDTALHILTSCPCAVYSYDVSQKYNNTYDSKSTIPSEVLSGAEGDPSMVWISPLEQKINRITFGVCATAYTTRHYLNVVVLTQDVANVQLSSKNRPNIPLSFTPVSGTSYSYARLELCNTKTASVDKVYTLSCPSGFIAHVYGNGDQESYAYSVGSSAVKRGIQVGGYSLEDGMISPTVYCINTPIEFNAEVGTLKVDTAYWDMGDGVTFTDQSRISFSYTYETPGWYDVVAQVAAHKECPDTIYPMETVNVRIHVVRPDTIRRNFFVCETDLPFVYGGESYMRDTTDIATFDCDSVVIFHLEVGKNTSYEYWEIAKDVFVMAGTGKKYYKTGIYTDTIPNKVGCDSVITAHATVITCLELSVGKPDSVICADEIEFQIPYKHTKGDIGPAYLSNRGLKTPITANPVVSAFVIPLKSFAADHYTNAQIIVEDTVCNETLVFPVSFDVLYPSSVFNQKWDNTLVLYNQQFNGGYDFKAYQWYKNGLPIPGATGSYIVEEPLDTAAFYQVMLTRYDTVSGDRIDLMTCPYQPVVKKAKSAPQSAQKVMENGRIYIIKENARFSVLGVAVKKE